MKSSFVGKKLLLVGGINNSCEIIDRAHAMGMKVGVVDYNHNTHARALADENFYNDIKDVDGIVRIVKERGYSGVTTNFIDFALPYASRIAKYSGLPVVFDEDQVRLSTNKKYFKETCRKYGVDIPREYHIDWECDLGTQDIVYPVIVKPVDGSGSKGISICSNEQELMTAKQKALATSRCGDMVVEQYISDVEVNLNYVIQDGIPTLSSVHDRYFNVEQKDVLRVPDVYIYPSRYTDHVLRKYDSKLCKMLRGIGLKNGSVFMQACFKNDMMYVYEIGMRFNGCKTYHVLAKENGFDTMDRMIQYAVAGDMGRPEAYKVLNPHFKSWYATLSILAKPATIGKYIGLDTLPARKGYVNHTQWYFEGENIPDSAKGTLAQTTARIDVCGRTKGELLDAIREVYSRYDVLDPAGRSILLHKHDLNDLEENIDYELC